MKVTFEIDADPSIIKHAAVILAALNQDKDLSCDDLLDSLIFLRNHPWHYYSGCDDEPHYYFFKEHKEDLRTNFALKFSEIKPTDKDSD